MTVEFLAADLGPGVFAGFTTRAGGRSPHPWESLNLGLGVGDDPDRVRRNRAIVAAAVGAPVAFTTQVHGCAVIVLPDAGAVPDCVGEADALVTRRTDVALGVLVADCVPVLLADPVAGVVGTAHAGRRGFAAGVVPRVLEAMRQCGAGENLRAVVGPGICGKCYEVPQNLRDQIAADHPAAWSTTAWGTPSVDLAAGVLAQLAAHGVPATAIEACTMSDERLFSHRRAQRTNQHTGRFAGVVRFCSDG